MKISYKLLLMLTVLIGFVFLTSCSVSYRIAEKSSNVLIKPKIKLKVDESLSTLVVTSDTVLNCAQGNSGCVAVGRWDTALITFELKKSDGWYFWHPVLSVTGLQKKVVMSCKHRSSY